MTKSQSGFFAGAAVLMAVGFLLLFGVFGGPQPLGAQTPAAVLTASAATAESVAGEPAGQAGQEQIDSFLTAIEIDSDASFTVTETIVYNFGAKQKHGIYRDIPVKYQTTAGNYTIKLSDINVTDENGRAYNFEESREGANYRIKIGDADRYVSGVKTYIISYQVQRAITYFSDHDELYWNATGNQWPVSIKQASAVVFLPAKIAAEQAKAACYQGVYGSTVVCAANYFAEADGVNKFNFSADDLAVGGGLTLVVSLPKGLVNEPTQTEKYLAILKDNWVLGLPFVAFVFMFGLWWTAGRDPKGTGTIIAQYEAPDGLSPAQVGTLVDEKADNRDLTAEIINLAVLGYLKIRREETGGLLGKKIDYTLIKLKPAIDGLLLNFQQELMDLFFDTGKTEVKLSALKNRAGKEMQITAGQIYKSLAPKYFANNPQMARGIWISAGVILATIAFAVLGESMGVYAVIALIATAAVIAIFGWFMPARTAAGVLAREKILGLKMYLSVAEKDRLNFHHAPAKNPEHFEKLLPYAMALKVEKEWAKQFEGIYNTSPSWYEGGGMDNFTAIYLISSLNNFRSETNAMLARSAAAGGSSGFGGGGFSGGGFGGGGGGSW